MQPLSLAGVRHSGGLGLVKLMAAGPAVAAELARELDRREANLAFLAGRRAGRGLSLALAVDQERLAGAWDLARGLAEAGGPEEPALLAPAALITAYPLSQCLPLVWSLTAGLLEQGLNPLVLATSPAAAVLAVAGQELEPALAALPALAQLPPGVAPQSQRVRVVQVAPGETPPPPQRSQGPETIAVYREDPIRTYGLAAAPGYCWLSAGAPLAGLDCARGLAALADAPKPAHLQVQVFAGRLELWACPTLTEAPALLEALAAAGLEPGPSPSPATLIHLQGPHFGDRHGIAAAALMAVAESGAAPLAVAGVVHSVFIVTPPEQAEAVRTALGRRFCAPN